MKRAILITSVFILLVSISCYGQETKRKNVQKGKYIEKYSVLKEDVQVKQGQYVRFKRDVFDRKVPVELGFFENGKRVGEWYFFYPNGALQSFGNYKDNEKYGLWIEYYRPILSKEKSVTSLFSIHTDIAIDENKTVAVAKKDTLIAAMGIYESDKKLGAWNYYDSNGKLIHKYGHSLDTLLFSSVSDSINRSYPYLGGIDRFYQHYFQKEEEFGYKIPPSESEVILKIDRKNGYLAIERISSVEDEDAAPNLEKIIKSIPADWIQSYIKKPILMEWVLKRDAKYASIYVVFKQIESDH